MTDIETITTRFCGELADGQRLSRIVIDIADCHQRANDDSDRDSVEKAARSVIEDFLNGCWGLAEVFQLASDEPPIKPDERRAHAATPDWGNQLLADLVPYPQTAALRLPTRSFSTDTLNEAYAETMMQLVARSLIKAVSDRVAGDFINGNGHTQTQGLLANIATFNGALEIRNAIGKAAPALSELEAMSDITDFGYPEACVWMMSAPTATAIDVAHSLRNPQVFAQAGMLLGKPVVITRHLADYDTGSPSLIYANLRAAYAIAYDTEMAITAKRLPPNEVEFSVSLPIGGAIRNRNACRVLAAGVPQLG